MSARLSVCRKRRGPEKRDGYRERNAVATGCAAARAAGSNPPTTPITNAKKTPCTRSWGVILNANARLEKVWKFMVLVVSPFKGNTAKQPNRPPTKAIKRASTRNENTTEAPPKPTARIVAISRQGLDTAGYMVFRAPKTAPMAILAAT